MHIIRRRNDVEIHVMQASEASVMGGNVAVLQHEEMFRRVLLKPKNKTMKEPR